MNGSFVTDCSLKTNDATRIIECGRTENIRMILSNFDCRKRFRFASQTHKLLTHFTLVYVENVRTDCMKWEHVIDLTMEWMLLLQMNSHLLDGLRLGNELRRTSKLCWLTRCDVDYSHRMWLILSEFISGPIAITTETHCVIKINQVHHEQKIFFDASLTLSAF